MLAASRLVLILALSFLFASSAFGGEYKFDIPEAEKKKWDFGGRLELHYIYHQLDQDSAMYRLKFHGGDKDGVDEWRPLLELNAGYDFGKAHVFLTTHHEYQKTFQGEEWVNKVYQGYLSLNPNPGLTLDIGKKSYLWGKGYAWNPAGFVNRPKDPDDPELNLEGYTALGLDLIKSFPGKAFHTVALTTVVIPVFKWENTDLGDTDDLNYALKLYFLLYDTDIDLIYFGGRHQPDNFGLDFSRNIKENLEIHGEAALRLKAEKKILGADDKLITRIEDQWSWLLGLRYLTRYDTTYILEYYHNGAGYDLEEVEEFFRFQDTIFNRFFSTGRSDLLEEAARKTSPYYQQRNYGRDYLYLKVSQKEPWGILYFTPWAAMIFNLGDGSFSLTPGLTYQPWTNFELGFKTMVPFGPKGTEFGEKLDSFRTELTTTYYF
ncbi:MAG: hypothetical protein V1742_07690 [Pseudomonadota bacterium]